LATNHPNQKGERITPIVSSRFWSALHRIVDKYGFKTMTTISRPLSTKAGFSPKMRISYRVSRLKLAALSLLVLTTISGALIMHSLSAHLYYNLNLIKLQTAADNAVNAGVWYLPDQPQSAIQVADAYAKLNGVMPSEIELTDVSSDHARLTIRLIRKMPFYYAALSFRLPSHDIAVSAFATRHPTHSRGHLVETAYLGVTKN
jgi:hypothetical protein